MSKNMHLKYFSTNSVKIEFQKHKWNIEYYKHTIYIILTRQMYIIVVCTVY